MLGRSDRVGIPEPVDRRPNRDTHATARTPRTKGFDMKKIGFASIIATGFAAAIVGLAGLAQADITHHQWVHDDPAACQHRRCDPDIR